MIKKRRGCLVLFVVAGWIAVWLPSCRTLESPPAPDAPKADREAAGHGRLFQKGLERVGERIHVAIGYGIANSIMIEGPDGIIIVDTMTTMEEGAEVLSAFRKITSKPVKAVIYTHAHPDHVFGAQAFTVSGSPEVYAHKDTEALVKKLFTETGPIIGSRSLRMYGNFLGPGQVQHVGIGPRVGLKTDSRLGFVRPTRTFSSTLEGEAAGVTFRLIHVPGETDDQIAVWLPDLKTLIPADNFYWAFPNLYTIRGTGFRSLKQWYKSIDTMRDLNPKFLVPCHTRPITGAREIQEILINYRDAIQYVHDQAIRGMNAGMTPDELAEQVQLPPHLGGAPYLQPLYGKVAWSVRAMFAGTLGWFDGDSTSLQPLTRKARARLMVRLAGGEKALVRQGEELLAGREYQAVLEVTGHLIQLNPEQEAAKKMRIRALTALGEGEQNPNARHYYLTEALEIQEGVVSRSRARPSPETVRQIPLESFFEQLAVNLDAGAAAEVNRSVGMVFPDAGEAFTIQVRRGVAEIRPRLPGDLDRIILDLKVRADSTAWKEMLARIRHPLITLAGFQYEKGNALAFGRFLKLFEPPEMKRPFEPAPGVFKGSGRKGNGSLQVR